MEKMEESVLNFQQKNKSSQIKSNGLTISLYDLQQSS